MSGVASTLRTLLAAALLVLAGAAQAQERILAYDSEVQVNADGSLDVVERIRVRAEGGNIRRGIYRDFPTRYKDRHGNNVVVGFDVVDVARDGAAEPWFTERVGNGVRINTGNDDLLPVPADYTYTLRFRTTRQVGFFADHDELYWNAIGHGWDFAIETGSVEVRLPVPVPAGDLVAEGYSGAFGTQGGDFEARIVAPGVARWTLTRPLPPREGLTTVLSFPKGVVAAPTRSDTLWWLLRDNLSLLAAFAGLLLLAAFCWRRWNRIGRDPATGVVIARYDPPRDESPAALRYMVRRSYDNLCLSSELLACAVKGAVTIEREDRMLGDAWTLQRNPGPNVLDNDDERRLLEALLPGSAARLALKKESATRIQAAIATHGKAFAKRFQPAMFSHNGGSIAIACVLFAASVAATLALTAINHGGGMPWALVPLGLALVVLITFCIVIGAPTPEGRRLLDEIEGFKRYLSVAEQDDLARLDAPASAGGAGAEPELDAARFEALLPYAVALGVEDAWTRRFTVAVGAAAAAAATAAIGWYQGGNFGSVGNFTKSVGSALSTQIASASSPPGSSSGGGGGGFSGGGGGGGGGGGR